MTATVGKMNQIDSLLDDAAMSEVEGLPENALALAWRALDLAPADLRAKGLVARLLRRNPDLASAERRADLERLLRDPDIDPDAIASAGWSLLLAQGRLALNGDPRAMTAALANDPLALALLTEAGVFTLDAEKALTEVRRWLLLSGEWANHPRLAQAFMSQTARNGGAWLFNANEGAVLQQSPALPFAAAYHREHRPLPPGGRFDDAVTQTVANQYVRWPYPVWSRLTAPQATTVPREVEKLDGGRSSDLPVEADVLVAGCGTGYEAALLARRFPDARVTAIDVSQVSLDYAVRRCAGLDVDFRLLDLHEAARLGRRFDLIACSGVLHHLPNPEAGWAKLVEVLKPGGVMQVMVYSRVGRLPVKAARTYIADLRHQPVDEDLLREVRRRLIEKASKFVAGSFDFYSLDGVHDLLLNRHEDPFDVPRIVRAFDQLGLELLAFELPTAADRKRYCREHPEDPQFRDVNAWAALEKVQPLLFSRMYKFWCRRAAT